MKIKYNKDNLVNGYFFDEILTYSNNEEYNDMLTQGNFIQVDNENFQRFDFAKIVNESYIQITQGEYNQLSNTLEETIKIKQSKIEKNYSASKLNCKISFEGSSYERIKGIQSLLNLCLQWKDYTKGPLVPSINFPIASLQAIFDEVMLLRDTIASNVESVKNQIGELQTNQAVSDFTTDLKITFDDELKIEDLLS